MAASIGMPELRAEGVHLRSRTSVIFTGYVSPKPILLNKAIETIASGYFEASKAGGACKAI